MSKEKEKPNNDYDIPNDINNEIIDYIYERVKGLNMDVFAKHRVRVNVFTEVIYDMAINKYKSDGSYILVMNDVIGAFNYVRNLDIMLEEYYQDKVELVGIKEGDILIFNKKKLIKNG